MISNNFFQLVAEFQKNIDWLNQVLKGGEGDSVNIDGTVKPSISKDIADKWAAISTMIQGRRAFETKAALIASGSPPNDKPLAEVWRDPTPEFNGLYGWTGSAWEKSAYDPVAEATKVMDAMQGVIDQTRGPSFPGPSEFYETLLGDDKSLLQIQDKNRAVLLELFGTELYYDGVYEAIGFGESSIFVMDKANKVVAVLGNSAESIENEVIDARGGNESLNDRLEKTLTPYGLPQFRWGEWLLRETRQRTQVLGNGESTALSMITVGDSWSASRTSWPGVVAKQLKDKFGYIGPGWAGFAWLEGNPPKPSGVIGSIDSNVSIEIHGDWVSNWSNRPTPDTCSVSSSTAGDYLILECNTSVTSATLFYIGSGNGVIEYSFDGGPSTTLNLSGVGLQTVELDNVPNTFTLKLSVVSGSVEISGVNLLNPTKGIVFHKTSASGSATSNWATQAIKQDWKDGVAALSPNLAFVMHGTNDQGRLISPEQYKLNLSVIIDSLRDVDLLMDILIIAPCENGRVNSIPMKEYQDKVMEVAFEKKCTVINLQSVFGESYDDYGHASNRKWFRPDLIHPENLTGGRVISDAILKTLLS